MKQLSPYYSLYINGLAKTQKSSKAERLEAISILKEALSIKKTLDGYKALARTYASLGDDDGYEATLLEAANNKFGEFYSSLGLFYANNPKGHSQAKALEWFQKGLESKNPKAYYEIARIYFLGSRAIEANFNIGVKVIQDGLALNDPMWNGYFHYLLGLTYYEKKDYGNALKSYEESLRLGHKEAALALACMYRGGVGVEKDPDKYVDYLLIDPNDNNLKELASVFLLGKLTPINNENALYLLQKPANHGDALGALTIAATLCEDPNYNKWEVDYYLEVAFKNGIMNQVFFDLTTINDCLDERTKAKIRELEEKYSKASKAKA